MTTRKKSKYAEKQGRARKSAGDNHDGPRTRYAKSSPLCESHQVNQNHRFVVSLAASRDRSRDLFGSNRHPMGGDYRWKSAA